MSSGAWRVSGNHGSDQSMPLIYGVVAAICLPLPYETTANDDDAQPRSLAALLLRRRHLRVQRWWSALRQSSC